MQRLFRTVKITDRLPDFGKRILSINEKYQGEFMSEYDPTETIPLKKGKFIQVMDSEIAIRYITGNFTHWLEEVTLDELNGINTKLI